LENIALDGAAVTRFPNGAGAVSADEAAGCVDEVGFGGLEDPLWTSGGLLAGVDLNAFAGDGEDGVLRGWRFRGVLSDRSGCEESCAESQEKAGSLHDRGVYRKNVSPVWMHETECADLWLVGGYWNDNDERSEDE
jgi:hypothetical protein